MRASRNDTINMKRTVYLNGDYLHEDEAKISIFDRAVLFGDAIYEVAGVLDGKLIDFESHMDRYHHSLAKLQMPVPLNKQEVLLAFRELIKRNQISEGMVYMQISRGVADRDYVYGEGLTPTVFMFTQHKPLSANEIAVTGVSLKSVDDIRWARRDIKTVNLLGQVFAKKQAKDAGADEALMIDDEGFVTECGSMSFFMVKDGLLLTRPLTNNILSGVTRKALIKLCGSHDLRLVETKFKLDTVLAADEVMICSACLYVLPVIKIDGQMIGQGQPGPIFKQLLEIYMAYARAGAI